MNTPSTNDPAYQRWPKQPTSACATPVQLDKHGLYLPLASGAGYFNYYWLRDFCSSNIDPQTGERIFDLSGLEKDPYPSNAYIENHCLHIVWLHEEHQSCIPLEGLKPYVHRDGRIPDPAAITRKLWGAGFYTNMVRLSAGDISSSKRAKQRFAKAIIEDGIVLVSNMADNDAALTQLAETIGPITPTVDGSYFDVRLTINPSNLAYTASALELHTDLPNEEAAPGVQFLHCRANSVGGGRSLFVDGAAAAQALREEYPDYFTLLSSHDIPFFRRYEGWNYRAYQRVIELDHAGNVSGVTVSQHLQDTIDLPQDVLDSYYPALLQFIRILKQERFINRFRLKGGECIVFDNHRVVHGREAFEANSGERHLRGCYVDRGALRSTYRTLYAETDTD